MSFRIHKLWCIAWTLVVCLATAAGCASTGMPAAERQKLAAPAITALQAGRFEDAHAAAEKVVAAEPKAAEAYLVLAVAHYRATMHTFVAALFGAQSMLMGNRGYGTILRKAIEDTERELGVVESYLGKAVVPDVALELCLACWEYDWNHSGEVDNNDRHMMEVEVDANGKSFPDGDPRRRPTFRFDVGDIAWARAMISFQRAAMDLVLAYRFEDALMQALMSGGSEFRLPLGSADRVQQMRARLLHGFDQADASRTAYLAEIDDDREWVPSPRQKSHPLPLPVDDKLFETWRVITDDLRKLVRGGEGIDVAQAAKAGDRDWQTPPRGFVNVGALFDHPADIAFSAQQAEGVDRHDPKATEAFLRQIFGPAFVPTMSPSHLITHIERMKNEVERGEESIERKLRYLLWLN